MTGAPARILLAGLLCLLAVPRASAVKTERLHRFAASAGGPAYVEVVSGSALVKFKTGVSTAAAAAALAGAGFGIVNSFERFGLYAVRLPGGMAVSSGLSLLKAMPQVEAAEPNGAYRVKRAPNDIYAARQYALAKVQAFGAWEYETGSSSRVTVAVMDTGIDAAHPELAGKLTGISRAFDPGSGAESPDSPPTPACNHATRVAGVAAASSDNSSGVAGMSWGAKLLSLKIFADSDCLPDCSDEAGLYSCTTSDNAIISALNYVIPKHNTAAYGKIIVNMSIGEYNPCGALLQPVVANAVSAGLLLVAAAGNGGGTNVDTPANCTGVIAVGATDMQDKLASFSNTGAYMTTKGVTAPGVDLYTTDAGGGYASATGTSFSSPLTAGLAALLWSAKPEKTAGDIWGYIGNSADDLGGAGHDAEFGWGRVNAYRALCSAVPCRSYAAGEKKASAYPNPFRPKTHNLLAFKTAPGFDTGGIEIKIYTSEGEQVRKLDGLTWDGKNQAGAAVASGVYIFRVKTDSDSAVGKFALIR